MIETWDGTTGREVVLDLLTYVSLGSFEGVFPLKRDRTTS
jgi:hypothetical protein